LIVAAAAKTMTTMTSITSKAMDETKEKEKEKETEMEGKRVLQVFARPFLSLRGRLEGFPRKTAKSVGI